MSENVGNVGNVKIGSLLGCKLPACPLYLHHVTFTPRLVLSPTALLQRAFSLGYNKFQPFDFSLYKFFFFLDDLTQISELTTHDSTTFHLTYRAFSII